VTEQAQQPPKDQAEVVVNLWGESGVGKTHFACTISAPPRPPIPGKREAEADYGPTCLLTCDKGDAVVGPLIVAGRVYVHRFESVDDLRSALEKIDRARRGPGGLRDPRGRPPGSVVIDAWSTLMRNEARVQDLVSIEARERALKLLGPFEAAFGATRELAQTGIPVVTVTHTRDRPSPSSKGAKSAEGGEVMVPTPDLFPSMQGTWMASADFVWMIEKWGGSGKDGKPLKNPYLRPKISVQTQPIGDRKKRYFVKHCKTRGIAFGDWIGESFAWETSWQKPQALAYIMSARARIDAKVAAFIAAGASEAESYERVVAGEQPPAPEALAPDAPAA
jgi:hypothetical protein